MIIWLLDCSNGCVTRVHLSKEKEEELNRYLDDEENGGDMESYISEHEDDFGVSPQCTAFMITDNENIYDIDF